VGERFNARNPNYENRGNSPIRCVAPSQIPLEEQKIREPNSTDEGGGNSPKDSKKYTKTPRITLEKQLTAVISQGKLGNNQSTVT
jgi:hypothetical protein